MPGSFRLTVNLKRWHTSKHQCQNNELGYTSMVYITKASRWICIKGKDKHACSQSVNQLSGVFASDLFSLCLVIHNYPHGGVVEEQSRSEYSCFLRQLIGRFKNRQLLRCSICLGRLPAEIFNLSEWCVIWYDSK